MHHRRRGRDVRVWRALGRCLALGRRRRHLDRWRSGAVRPSFRLRFADLRRITSGILAIVLSVVAAISPSTFHHTPLTSPVIVARQTIVPMKYRGYVPNPSAAGLAFVLPQTQYGLAMVIGASAYSRSP